MAVKPAPADNAAAALARAAAQVARSGPVAAWLRAMNATRERATGHPGASKPPRDGVQN
jgi:hypothetical protein